MKWVTRQNVKVDRVACPWPISKFVDPKAEFLFVPSDQVMSVSEKQQAIPYDVPHRRVILTRANAGGVYRQIETTEIQLNAETLLE